MTKCRVENCDDPVFGSIFMKKYLKIDGRGVYFNDELVVLDIEPWYYCRSHYELLGGINRIIDKIILSTKNSISDKVLLHFKENVKDV